MFYDIYQSLKSGFQQSWFKFLFQNTALAKLISQSEAPSAWVFFNTYYSSWWWNRLWFRSCMKNHLEQFDDIYRCLKILEKSGILTEDNCNMVVEHGYLVFLYASLRYLARVQILNQNNFAIVATHDNPNDICSALDCLNLEGILNQYNFSIVATHDYPLDMALVFYYLQEAGILTRVNRDGVGIHPNPMELRSVLSSLQKAGILNQDNFDIVTTHTDPQRIALAFCYLQEARILTRVNRDVVGTHANLQGMTYALRALQKASILNQDNFDIVNTHANLQGMTIALYSFQEAGILNQDNFDIVNTHPNLSGIADALFYLKQATILNQDNFAALIAPNHAILVSEQVREIWHRIPSHLLSQTNFQRLLTAAEHDTPMEELQRVCNQILAVHTENHHVAVFNREQSTHTASVHRSVSDSAVNLMTSYGNGLNINDKIQEIKVFVNGLDDSPRHQAAKRCIERITRRDYMFTDDTSMVSTHQLIALIYTAIHDVTKCTAALEDTKVSFVQGLYEIQRGYNLNNAGEDLGGEDHPICVAGTFNKLMEKLGGGIHPDVEINYITHEGASLKFNKLVQAHALTYLTAIMNPTTPAAYLSMKSLLAKIEDAADIQTIWPMIKEKVRAELWDEFKEAYAHNPEHVEFNRLFSEHFRYVPAPDLAPIYQELANSIGYHAYLSEHRSFSSLLHYSLWANRHDSGEAQHEFDSQYGLVVRI